MSIKSLFGDKAFYRRVLTVAIPIMIQMGVTNFVNLLDNIMVGRLGNESMSGVSIVNQFVFIFILLVFGATSAAGIFTAQYHGIGNVRGERDTFRLKMVINVIAAAVGTAIFFAFGDELISLFLHEGSDVGDLEKTLSEGRDYLSVMLFAFVPYAVAQVYASTMKETGETVMPAVASVAAVAVNFVLNLLLIFGYCGAPALGVRGAAIATVVSRFVELGILVIWGHTHTKIYPFLVGVYRSLSIPADLIRKVTVKGLPLMANEVLWALAMTMRNQCYSTRGLAVVGAQNICTTLFNVSNVIYMSVGSAIAIIVGSLLGAGKVEEAKDTDRKMLTFSVLCGTALCGIMVLTAPYFPYLYKSDDPSVHSLATYMITVSALLVPFCAYAHSSYYTLRSGGRVGITLLLDSGFMWFVAIPISVALCYFTDLSIYWVFPICQGAEIIKAVISYFLLRNGSWAQQLVNENDG